MWNYLTPQNNLGGQKYYPINSTLSYPSAGTTSYLLSLKNGCHWDLYALHLAHKLAIITGESCKGKAVAIQFLRHHVPQSSHFFNHQTDSQRLFLCNLPGSWPEAVQYLSKKAEMCMQTTSRRRRGFGDPACFLRRNLLLSALKTKFVYQLSKQAAWC